MPRDHAGLFDTALFVRADGVDGGKVSLRTLLEDFEADGQIGFLAAAVPDPDLIQHDLAVVVRHPAIHAGFRRLFGEGYRDYAPRLRAAPHRAPAARLNNTLDKLARTLTDAAAREAVAALDPKVVPSGPDQPWLQRSPLTLNADHPRTKALASALGRGHSMDRPLAAALLTAIHENDPEPLLGLLEALAG